MTHLKKSNNHAHKDLSPPIVIGGVYHIFDEYPNPASLKDSEITVISISHADNDDSLSIGYKFTNANGKSGNGIMSRKYAKSQLIILKKGAIESRSISSKQMLVIS